MSGGGEKKGEYKNIDKDDFWTGPMVTLTSGGGWQQQKFAIEIFKWSTYDPTQEEYDRELDGRTTRISITEYNTHTKPDGTIGQQTPDSMFKLNIPNFKAMLGYMQNIANTLLGEATTTLHEKKLLLQSGMVAPNISTSQWVELINALYLKLTQLGWFLGNSIPFSPQHIARVAELRQEKKLNKDQGETYHHALLTFKNPAKEHKQTEDSMIVTMQLVNERGLETFRQKFCQTSSPESRVHYLAATLQLSVALQLVCEKQLVSRDTVLLIAPAVFALIKYCNKPGNILVKNLPLKFGQPSEINVDTHQQSSMAKDDGTFDNKTLRELQWKNLLYMNNSEAQLTLCPGQVTAEDISSKQQQSLLSITANKENIPPLAIMPSPTTTTTTTRTPTTTSGGPAPSASSKQQQPDLHGIDQEFELNDIDADDIQDIVVPTMHPPPPPPPAAVVPPPPKPKQRKNKQQQQPAKKPATTSQKRSAPTSGSPSAAASQKNTKRAKKSLDATIVDGALIASTAQQVADQIQQEQQQQQQQQQEQFEDDFASNTHDMIQQQIAAIAAAGGGGEEEWNQGSNNNNNNKMYRSAPFSQTVEL